MDPGSEKITLGEIYKSYNSSSFKHHCTAMRRHYFPVILKKVFEQKEWLDKGYVDPGSFTLLTHRFKALASDIIFFVITLLQQFDSFQSDIYRIVKHLSTSPLHKTSCKFPSLTLNLCSWNVSVFLNFFFF